METVMPKLKTETQTVAKPDRTTQRRRSPKAPRRADAIASNPQLARIEQALRDAADAAFDLAHEKTSSAPERACIRRVRRAFLARTRTVPEFEDLAVTADALLRAFESQLGPVDPRVGQMLIHEIARSLHAPAPRVAAPVVRRMPMQRVVRGRHPFDGESFYGFA